MVHWLHGRSIMAEGCGGGTLLTAWQLEADSEGRTGDKNAPFQVVGPVIMSNQAPPSGSTLSLTVVPP